MGTDIYLNWDGKSEEEDKAQFTGFDTTKGNVGYLRASIGMHTENQALRLIFPNKFWNGDGGENGPEYDFMGNQSKIAKALKDYVKAVKDGKDELTEHPMPEMQEMESSLVSMFGKLGWSEIKTHTKNDIAFATRWAMSVASFCDLGAQKQREGKHPRVYISW